MARSNPSFLKRQKEQARKDKAAEKRADRVDRKDKPREEETLELLTGPVELEPDPLARM